MQTKYDRLHGIKTEEETFDFICPKCKKNGIKDKSLISIDPINISYRPVGVDNSDLPKNIRRYYDSLPTESEAILQAVNKDGQSYAVFSCRDCGSFNVDDVNINKTIFKQWMKEHFPLVMDLSIRMK